MIRDLIKAIKSLLHRMPETRIVHPEKFNDPIASRCGWECLKTGSANFVTHKLVKSPENNLVYRSTLSLKIFSIAFIIVGLALMTLYFCGVNEHWIMLVIGPIVVLAGIVVAVQNMIPIGFDSRKRVYYRGWKQKNHKEIPGPKSGVFFRQIHAIQLLTKIGKVSSSSENFHSDSYFYAYELNLILHDAGRKYVMSYINKDQALTDANKISELVEAPVWKTI